MNQGGPERNVELESGFTIQKVEDFWETAWNFLERTADPPVTDARQLVQDGNYLIEVRSTWDADSLETLTITSWEVGRGDPHILKPFAFVAYRHPGYESIMRWETRGGVSDSWLDIVGKALNAQIPQVVEQ